MKKAYDLKLKNLQKEQAAATVSKFINYEHNSLWAHMEFSYQILQLSWNSKLPEGSRELYILTNEPKIIRVCVIKCYF